MTKKKYFIAVTILCGTLMLSACGTTKTDRALIGGAVGAATGVLTTKNQIDLNR